MKKACKGNSRYKLTKEQLRLLKQLGINDMLSTTETLWYAHFNDLLQFYSKNHHLNIPRSVLCSDGTILLLWTRQQRGKYRKHTLSERYVDEFRKHGLMEVLETPLDIAMRHVEEYYKEHGNIDFDTSYVCPDGYKLGIWLRTIREKYLGNKNKRPYPQEVIDRLNEMGMIWSKKEEIWQKKYLICKSYLETHEGAMFPDDLRADDGTSIKNWIVNNRKAFKKGTLTAEKMELLSAIHILDITFYSPIKSVTLIETAEIFKGKYGQIWLENYKLCKKHLDKNGSNLLPNTMQTVGETKMNMWVYVNRQRYKEGKLPKEKSVLLEAINILEIKFSSPKKQMRYEKKSEDNLRTRSLQIKMTEEEYAVLETLTEQSGFDTISDYVRSILLK